MERIISTVPDLDKLIRYLGTLKLPFTIKITDGRMRSLDQNRLYQMWTDEAARQRPGMTRNDIQCEWKLLHGIPILCAASETYAASWEMVKRRFSYTQQLAMMDMIDVTSRMTVTEMKLFLDEVWGYNVANGIELSDPEELRYGPKIGSRVDRSHTRHAATTVGETKDSAETKREVR